jgi:hypothetical protein
MFGGLEHNMDEIRNVRVLSPTKLAQRSSLLMFTISYKSFTPVLAALKSLDSSD